MIRASFPLVKLSFVCLMVLGISRADNAYGREVLVNGTLESSASPTGWILENSITGQPDLDVNVTEQLGGNAAEFEEGLGLFIRPFAGNIGSYAGQNYAVNSILSQTVSATAGRTYTFSGSSRWQGDGDPDTNDGYSGGVDFLLPESPSDPDMTGNVPSPTQTFFQIEFLANDEVIGAPIRLNLRDDDQTNENVWAEHAVSGDAPDGTRQIRVSAAALDMVDNVSAQIAFFDSFSLRDETSPGTERLQNADLDTLGAPLGFDVQEERDGVDTLIGFRDFANHTPDGQQGFWLRAFAGGNASISQEVAAVAGAAYEFSTWSRWEEGYSGGLDDPSVVTSISIEFLDEADNVLSVDSLNLIDADQTNDGIWRQFAVGGTAPETATTVRIRAGATGMYNTGINPQSAFFDDFSLTETLDNIIGDYNGDGQLDAADLDLQATGIQGNDPNFDLNGDGSTDFADRIQWVQELKGSWIGDSDLDGEFSSSDLVAVFVSGEYEDAIALNSNWSSGDWNGDGDFDSSDLVAAFVEGGYEQGPRSAVVPEPTATLLSVIVLGATFGRRFGTSPL